MLMSVIPVEKSIHDAGKSSVIFKTQSEFTYFDHCLFIGPVQEAVSVKEDLGAEKGIAAGNEKGNEDHGVEIEIGIEIVNEGLAQEIEIVNEEGVGAGQGIGIGIVEVEMRSKLRMNHLMGTKCSRKRTTSIVGSMPISSKSTKTLIAEPELKKNHLQLMVLVISNRTIMFPFIRFIPKLLSYFQIEFQ